MVVYLLCDPWESRRIYDEKNMLRHIRLISTKTWTAAHRAAPQGNAKVNAPLSVRRKRIIYRSGQRGWLELDVILGRWAASRVPTMTAESDLSAIEGLLSAETPHLLQWVLGHSNPPPEHDTAVMRDIQRFAQGDTQ